MLHALLCSFFVLASPAGEPSLDGAAWLEKSESHLYAWPRPGSLVSFQVKTNLLEAAIAALEKDPAVAADPEKGRWIDALRHPSISSTLDTETGKVTTDVVLRFEPTSPQGQAASKQMKSGIGVAISNAFQGLPFQDPSLLHKSGSVVGAEEKEDAVLVTITGKTEKDRSTLRLNRRTELPETIEAPDMTIRMRYSEVVPGRFAPSEFVVRSPSGQESRAEYTYQKAGELAFPSTIRLSQGTREVALSVVSVKVDPRPH